MPSCKCGSHVLCAAPNADVSALPSVGWHHRMCHVKLLCFETCADSVPEHSACGGLHVRMGPRRHWYQGLKRPDNYLTATEVRQMAGRAGRTGLDEYGEAIMVVPDRDTRAEKHVFAVFQVR